MTDDQIRELIRELIKQTIDEMSVTGDVAGYQTPNAFGRKRKKDSTPPQWSKVDDDDDDDMEELLEVTYRSYKKESAGNPKKRVNLAIKEINGKLFRVERLIDQNLKLKKESGVNSKAYWGSTRSSINKMYERMQRIGQKIRRLGEI